MLGDVDGGWEAGGARRCCAMREGRESRVYVAGFGLEGVNVADGMLGGLGWLVAGRDVGEWNQVGRLHL